MMDGRGHRTPRVGARVWRTEAHANAASPTDRRRKHTAQESRNRPAVRRESIPRGRFKRSTDLTRPARVSRQPSSIVAAAPAARPQASAPFATGVAPIVRDHPKISPADVARVGPGSAALRPARIPDNDVAGSGSSRASVRRPATARRVSTRRPARRPARKLRPAPGDPHNRIAPRPIARGVPRVRPRSRNRAGLRPASRPRQLSPRC